MYSEILEQANLTGKETVFDMYCGTGTIALYLAKFSKEVFGFETVSSSVEDALRNSVRNGLGNTKFFKTNLEKTVPYDSLPVPDVIVVDPPRAGLIGNAIRSIISFGAKKIIYVSCNPTTQARDTIVFEQNGYKLRYMSLVDMFPHTPHIETIGIFEPSD